MRRLRGVVVFKASKPTIQWHDQPKPASFNRAERELDRLNVPDAKAAADELRHGDVKMVAAGELVRRMTGRELPAVDDDRVQREVQRIRDGRRLRPILVVGDCVADGEHRLGAVHHLDDTAPVAVIAIRSNTEKRKVDKVSKMKKNAITPAAAAGVHQCAAIMRPHMSQPAVEAWISKGLALADDIAQPTAGANGWTEPVTKADAQLEESLNELAELRKRDDLSLDARERVRKVSQSLQLAYLRKESPAAAAAVEAARRGEAPAPDGGVAAKAERLTKAGVGYDELLANFTKAEQSEYLASVRGVG